MCGDKINYEVKKFNINRVRRIFCLAPSFAKSADTMAKKLSLNIDG
jgi:hypothetical protein